MKLYIYIEKQNLVNLIPNSNVVQLYPEISDILERISAIHEYRVIQYFQAHSMKSTMAWIESFDRSRKYRVTTQLLRQGLMNVDISH